MPDPTASDRLHVPLPVHDALRRGRPAEAVKALREANPGLDARSARAAVERIARDPATTLADDDPYRPAPGAAPGGSDTLPSAVAARIATGNVVDAARSLRDARPDLSAAEAEAAVTRHASPLLQQARTETVVQGDSRRFGWAVWVLLLVALGAGLALLSGRL